MFYIVNIKFYLTKIVPLLLLLLNVFLLSRGIEKHEVKEEVKQKVKDKDSESVHDNFYMEGSQNIDMKNFKLLINNDICDEKDITIVTIVSTAVENKAGIQCILYTCVL